MEKFSLANGLNVYYYPLPNAYSICIGMYVKVGSRYENASNNGISHLLEHMHFRRLENMTQKELYQKTDMLGTTLMASTYKEFTRYYMKIRPHHLERGIEILKNVIEMYTWTSQDVDSEKKVVLNQWREEQEYISLSTHRNQMLWKNNALSFPVIGDEASIERINLDDLIDFKEKYYSAENIAFVITGAVNQNNMLRANTLFSEAMTKRPFSEIIPVSPSVGARKSDISLINYSSNYLDVSISFAVDSSINRETLTILNSILGGGTTSILQQVIREEMGMSANIYSEIEEYADAAVINIILSTDKKNLYVVLNKIIEIINSIKENVSDVDLAMNLPFYTDNLWFQLEDVETLNFQLGWDLHVKGLLPYDIEDKINAYTQVSKEKLMLAARNIFLENAASVVILGAVRNITKKEIKRILSSLG